MAMLSRMEPFREIARLQEEMSRLLGADERRAYASGESVGWTPACDVYEDDESVVLRFELAGVDPKGVEIRFERVY